MILDKNNISIRTIRTLGQNVTERHTKIITKYNKNMFSLNSVTYNNMVIYTRYLVLLENVTLSFTSKMFTMYTDHTYINLILNYRPKQETSTHTILHLIHP